MKKSAVKALRRNTPQRNAWLAMLGPCIDVPHGARMAALATYCARVRELTPPLPAAPKQRRAVERFNRQRLQRIKRSIAPRLVALLFDALADLNAETLEQFAAIVRRLREHKCDPQAALQFEDRALRVADLARLKGEPLLTPRELLRRLGVDKEHDDASRERKALKRLGIKFASDKRGRKKGTRNR